VWRTDRTESGTCSSSNPNPRIRGAPRRLFWPLKSATRFIRVLRTPRTPVAEREMSDAHLASSISGNFNIVVERPSGPQPAKRLSDRARRGVPRYYAPLPTPRAVVRERENTRTELAFVHGARSRPPSRPYCAPSQEETRAGRGAVMLAGSCHKLGFTDTRRGDPILTSRNTSAKRDFGATGGRRASGGDIQRISELGQCLGQHHHPARAGY